jgi:hypothetical protein
MMLKKILDFFVKEALNSSNKNSIAENNNLADKDKEELLTRIKKLEDKHIEMQQAQNQKPANEEDYFLTDKQIEFALTLLDKISREYQLAVEPSTLTVKDLNRLVAYNRYHNKGALVNLEKKGILRKNSKVFN